MTRRRFPSRSRRHYLKDVGACLGVVGLAGCVDVLHGDSGRVPSGTVPPTENETGMKTATTDSTAPSTPGGTTTPATGTAATPIHAEYETTDVRVTTPDGVELGAVTAAIADTPELRYLGLSDTESLPTDRGMLFVFETENDRRFVMREMAFGIDIVYADAAGVITRIHHAPAPGPGEDGNDHRYPGRGKYVLEVTYEWTVERGIEEGDVLEFEL